MDPEITLLLSIIDEAYEKKAWHGPNLRGSLKGVTAETAAWRPAKGRHNIWEIVIHAAYWKYAVRRRLLGEKRGSFPLKGSNWIATRASSGDAAEWKKDLKLLNDVHRAMREAVAGLQQKELYVQTPGSKVTNVRTIFGIAAHDLYHAGQIQLLKRLHESRHK
ncbi:DinB family protein [bacterium]|nr:MAG: DinB family protein [bacterium]